MKGEEREKKSNKWNDNDDDDDDGKIRSALQAIGLRREGKGTSDIINFYDCNNNR